MPIVTVCNHKGGCGKTTTTLNLASLMARFLMYLHKQEPTNTHPPRILLVDMDPQAGSNYCLRNKGEAPIKHTLDQLLMVKPSGAVPLLPSVMPSTWEFIDYIPTSEEGMVDANVNMTSRHANPTKVLDSLLRPLNSTYDFIFVDSGPSRGSFMWNVLYCGDMIIIPSIMEASNVKGARETILNIEYLAKVEGRKPYFVGLLPTVFRKFRKIDDHPLKGSHEEYAQKVETAFKEYGVKMLHPIRESMDSQQAYGKKVSIQEHNPKAGVLSDYSDLVEELYNGEKNHRATN